MSKPRRNSQRLGGPGRMGLWWCALTGRHGPLLRVAVTALAGEGVLVVANRGDCPLGGVQERLGDPVPLFELVLSPRQSSSS